MSIPVIDLFAGPGGLGEGFSRAQSARFEVAVSIEKDPMAYETLLMRAAHRALARSGSADAKTWRAWDAILADAPWEAAFDRLEASKIENIEAACKVARAEAWNLELGPDNHQIVSRGIRQRLRPFMQGTRLPDNIVLIGGPPCQAYSVVGRSRNRGIDGYVPEEDHRHFLYREYLQVIREFRPAVFVMENVKGILSARVADRHIFHTITADLRRPDLACGEDTSLEYELVALSPSDDISGLLDDPAPQSYIVQAELHGIPQARHRVIICGVRRDVFDRAGAIRTLRQSKAPTVCESIGDLPRLRPELSFRGVGIDWIDSLDRPIMAEALKELRARKDASSKRVAGLMAQARMHMRALADTGSGHDRFRFAAKQFPVPSSLSSWYHDRPMTILANHQSRAHMPDDLVRYLFVSAYGKETRSSPKLADFPKALLPQHKNVDPLNIDAAIFKDRFRVQVAGRFSTTITSHIGKDGHAFIHPDPLQCRSLTVREAARLQTFPDSYVFLGPRTSQYVQVGNAVPPYLARQIAEVVGEALNAADLNPDVQPLKRAAGHI